ncbi:sodium-coupled monocarboxylate transporter 1-like isoform X2 [Amphiura filiformis]|uniref:sodium-coupled monocarboxylate transporter 1-like isoform X2 n=1 Tax=Amphiura filiformis TaxID=82378 RepID=UPI003B21FF12
MVAYEPTFGIVDYILLLLMLLISAAVGLYFACRGNKQRTTEEYLLADRDLSFFPVAMSLLAGFMSAIAYLGIPADVYKYGTMWWWYAVAHVLAIWITTTTFMPVFYRLKLVSVNEYLELRFSRTTRLCAAFIFFVQKCFYMGLVVYAPCLVLATVTGMAFEWSVLLIVIICTFYTCVGGLKAVVWTDVFQMTVALSGFFAIIIKGSVDFGGFSNIWDINERGQRIEFFNLSPDPRARHTVWSIVIGGTFVWLYISAVNQMQVQRLLACKTLNTARLSLILYGFGLVLITTLPCMVALVAYAYYNKCDPRLAGKIQRDDQIVAYLVVDIFRDFPGLPGIFVSSCFSAALSSMSSALNSLAAITGEDIVKAMWPNISDTRYTMINKITVVFFGLVFAGLTFLADVLGKLIQTVLAFAGTFGGPLLGLFCLGIFCPRANNVGAITGFLVSLTFGLWITTGAYMYPSASSGNSLPISTEDCMEDVAGNSTALFTMSTTENPMSFVNETMTEIQENEEFGYRSGIMGLYSLSYTWYCCILCLITILIGLPVSIIKDGGRRKTEVRTKNTIRILWLLTWNLRAQKFDHIY